jgi:hypothetical protein
MRLAATTQVPTTHPGRSVTSDRTNAIIMTGNSLGRSHHQLKLSPDQQPSIYREDPFSHAFHMPHRSNSREHEIRPPPDAPRFAA